MNPKVLFAMILALAPAAIAAGVQREDEVLASNESKRDKVIDSAANALSVLDSLAGHELSAHPEIKAKLGLVTDALVALGRTAQSLAEAGGALKEAPTPPATSQQADGAHEA